MKPQIIDSNPFDTCSLCGRNHRKLYLLDGFKLGKNCLDTYKLYKETKCVENFYQIWHGWENRLNKVLKMIGINK